MLGCSQVGDYSPNEQIVFLLYVEHLVPSGVVKEFFSPKRISTPTFFNRATDTRFLSYAGTCTASLNSTLLALPSLSFTQKTARPLPHSFDTVLLAHPTTPSISSFSSANSFLSLIMWFVQPLSTSSHYYSLQCFICKE